MKHTPSPSIWKRRSGKGYLTSRSSYMWSQRRDDLSIIPCGKDVVEPLPGLGLASIVVQHGPGSGEGEHLVPDLDQRRKILEHLLFMLPLRYPVKGAFRFYIHEQQSFRNREHTNEQ